MLVLEAEETIGGGTRSAALTLPGFVHDICSAVHPLGIGSAFFRELPLHQHGLEWIHTQLYTPPVASLNPYATPVKGIYICSSSTPPGGAYTGCAATSRPRRRYGMGCDSRTCNLQWSKIVSLNAAVLRAPARYGAPSSVPQRM